MQCPRIRTVLGVVAAVLLLGFSPLSQANLGDWSDDLYVSPDGYGGYSTSDGVSIIPDGFGGYSTSDGASIIVCSP